MAGLGRKVFNAGEVLSAANVQGYLQDQVVQVYSGTAARSSALGTAVSEGMMSYLTDSNELSVYTSNGTAAWSPVNLAQSPNAIINGGFDIWQRGTAAVTTSTFSADRWNFYGQGSGTGHSATRQTFTPGAAPVTGYESEFYYQDVITSGSDANTQLLMLQKIEDVRKFAGETVTMSFWAKATSGTPKIGAELYQDFGSGGSAAVAGTGQSATLSTSWARYSFTFAVPSITGKTIGTGSSLYANIWFSAGSTWNTRSGSVGLQSATFHIWGVQLEAGSVATPFRRSSPTLQGELAACQRYYQRQLVAGGGEFAVSTSGSSVVLSSLLPVEMRTNPSSSTTMTNANYGTGNWTFVLAGIAALSKTGTVTIGNASRLQQLQVVFTGATYSATPNGWQNLSSGSIYVELSAEL